MIYKVHSSDASTLLKEPETGMGYQIVEARQYNEYITKKMVVYNSNLAVDLDDDFQTNKNKIVTKGYSNILASSSELMLDPPTIRVLENNSSSLSESRLSYKGFLNKNGAKDNPKENANGEEMFVRLSAYKDDKRIDFENNRLKEGSFTTTEVDYKKCIANDDDPVDRYALPNDEKIEWAFYIQPKKEDELQRGTVQPDFGKRGGGIEAYFENGTSDGTYLERREYEK